MVFRIGEFMKVIGIEIGIFFVLLCRFVMLFGSLIVGFGSWRCFGLCLGFLYWFE